MDKRGVSSTTAADDIDDGCVQDTKAFNADEEHDDQNRKGAYREGDKDGVYMRNELCVDAGVIDDIQNKIRRMQISKTIRDVIPQGRGRINEDHAEGQSKSWPYGFNEKSYDLEEKPMKRTRNLTEKGREYQL